MWGEKGDEFWCITFTVKFGTNNICEYLGLIAVLKETRRRKIWKIEIKGDAEIIIKAVNQRKPPTDPILLLLYAEAMDLSKDINLTLCHIARKHNERADALSGAGSWSLAEANSMMASRGRCNRSYHSPSFTLSKIFQLPDAFPVLKPKKINMMRAFAEDAKMSEGGNIVSSLPWGIYLQTNKPKNLISDFLTHNIESFTGKVNTFEHQEKKESQESTPDPIIACYPSFPPSPPRVRTKPPTPYGH
jgi:ribonuclease HI